MLIPRDDMSVYSQESATAQDYCAKWQDKLGKLYLSKGLVEFVPTKLCDAEPSLGFAKTAQPDYSKTWSLGQQDYEEDDSEEEEERLAAMFLGIYPVCDSSYYFLPVFLYGDKIVLMYPDSYAFNRFMNDKDEWFWEKFSLVQRWNERSSSSTLSAGITQFGWKQMYHEVRP